MRRLSKKDMEALGKLPGDGSWLEMPPRRGAIRPEGVSLATWDRLVMAWVPDSFWKPEYEERMRSWIAKEYTGRGASLRGRVRLSKAGVALMRQYAETGTVPSQA